MCGAPRRGVKPPFSSLTASAPSTPGGSGLASSRGPWDWIKQEEIHDRDEQNAQAKTPDPPIPPASLWLRAAWRLQWARWSRRERPRPSTSWKRPSHAFGRTSWESSSAGRKVIDPCPKNLPRKNPMKTVIRLVLKLFHKQVRPSSRPTPKKRPFVARNGSEHFPDYEDHKPGNQRRNGIKAGNHGPVQMQLVDVHIYETRYKVGLARRREKNR